MESFGQMTQKQKTMEPITLISSNMSSYISEHICLRGQYYTLLSGLVSSFLTTVVPFHISYLAYIIVVFYFSGSINLYWTWRGNN